MTDDIRIAYKALDDKFGQDIVVLDISNISTMADYFIIATGGNTTQVKAMADEVVDKLHKAGRHARHTEGYSAAQWILLDFDDIIIHVFNKDTREFYNLERVWGDATLVEI